MTKSPHLGLTHHKSQRSYAGFPSAAPGAPSVIYVVLDDVG
ncbi:hypothetical protein [Mesobacterium pallidum]|nr:hypothetical protein [Mesobacterium pallidum]